jgi:uncharacterized membrane protein
MVLRHLEVIYPWAFGLLAVLLPVVLWATWRTFDPMRGARKALVMVVRVLVVVLAVGGLASVRWWRQEPEKRICVMAVVDVSRGVPDEAIEKVLPQVEELLGKADADHEAGLIVFGGDAKVAITPGAKVETGSVKKAIAEVRGGKGGVAIDGTNIERALDLAMGVFPPGYGRRVVLFTDGNATDGDALGKVHRCRGLGIDVSTVAMADELGTFDVAVTSVSVPTRIVPGVGFDVNVQVAARAAGDATLALYRNGYLLEERKLSLAAGGHNEVFRQRLDEPGLFLYRAKISCKRKQATLANDTAFAFTRLKTGEKVLVLGESDVEARHLMGALREGGMICEFRTADGAPENLPDLLDFDAVVLNNLRASSLNSSQQRLLRDYVELFGGGMVVIGLDGVGGYAGTPVEDALPVVCGAERLNTISTSVVVIADTSPSLTLADAQDAAAGDKSASRPEIIRRTAKQILSGLSERDYFGLVGFASPKYSPKWVVRPQKVYDRAKMDAEIDAHLQTSPVFPDPQALASLVQRMAAPSSPMPPEQLAKEIEKLLDPRHLPHLAARPFMAFVRDKLHATKEAINPEEITQAVERLIEPNAFLGGSDAYPSIARAVTELQQRETARKSIILLTDGYLVSGEKQNDTTNGTKRTGEEPANRGQDDSSKKRPTQGVAYDRLAGELAADGITISTIALKQADANTSLLENISRWGIGQTYRLSDPAEFAAQFKKELEAASKPRVMEFGFQARKMTDSPLVRGVDVASAPQLFGYVRSAAKLGATNVLAAGPDFEPLLATWDFGAGRTAVFTSDAQDRWASLWVKDWGQGYNRLWSSVMHGVCEKPVDRRILPQLDVHGQHVELAVDFVDGSNRFLNGEKLTARFYWLGEEGYVFSRTAMEEVPLLQKAPGKYVCEYKAPEKGIYVARVGGAGPRDVAAVGFVVSLLAEETTLAADEGTVNALAAAGGGNVNGKPDQWMSLGGKMREQVGDVSQWAMMLAAVLFAMDVVLRRWPAVAGLLKKREAA